MKPWIMPLPFTTSDDERMNQQTAFPSLRIRMERGDGLSG
jgi:hypothetical protein